MPTRTAFKTFKLVIEYDGTDFHGWQRQVQDRTVQETIEKALERMTREKISLIGSGRTDAGVHAMAQTASFQTASRLDAGVFLNGLNSLLPRDVRIHACRQMPAGFHARFNVTGKHYRYHILNRPIASAITRRFCWHIQKSLDVGQMQTAAAAIVGTHDFKAFEGAGSPRAHTVRTVTESVFQKEENGNLTYDIRADGFLRFMVRNIVGTLVEVGLGKRQAEEMTAILESKSRDHAGATAPPQGLFLMEVNY